MNTPPTLNTRITLFVLLFLLLNTAASGRNQQNISGTVFHDLNENGTRHKTEPGLPGILVSNGDAVAVTDENGRYRLTAEENSHIFVIKPRGWTTHTDHNGIARFYYTHSPGGAEGTGFRGLDPTGPLPESIDFALYPNPEENRFRIILFGDTQPRNIGEIHYLARDTVQELVGADASFGITLGDLVFDDLNLFWPLNQVIGRIGLPWRHLMGNHDMDYSADTDWDARGTYYRTYGPSYYAFSWGGTHFVAVDNIRMTAGEEGHDYRTGMDRKQLNFIANFLEHVPDNELVFFLMHIPWIYSTPWENEEERNSLLELLASHPNSVSLAAHSHRHFHRFISRNDGWTGQQPHHMISMGPTSGAWWSGAPDEYNIPHAMMRDGTPTGYAFLDIDGSDWKLRYKASRRPDDFQMHIHGPDTVSFTGTAETSIFVNVFNALPDARVEMRIGESGGWRQMSRTETRDPVYQAMRARERVLENVSWRLPGDGEPSRHLWSGMLPGHLEPGTYTIHIRAEDKWAVYEGRRIIRVTGS